MKKSGLQRLNIEVNRKGNGLRRKKKERMRNISPEAKELHKKRESKKKKKLELFQKEQKRQIKLKCKIIS